MADFRSIRSRLILVNLAATQPLGDLSFPDQPDLRGCELIGFETFDVRNLAVAPNGVAVVSAADSLNLIVTMADSSTQKVKQVPYSSCNRTLNGGLIRAYRDLLPTWEQCNVKVTAPLAAATASVALILVHYRYPSDPAV